MRQEEEEEMSGVLGLGTRLPARPVSLGHVRDLILTGSPLAGRVSVVREPCLGWGGGNVKLNLYPANWRGREGEGGKS